jgi:hypothetical protein
VTKLAQHEVAVELGGLRVVGHYTLERRGRYDRLTVWYRGRSLTDPEIAHEADPGSTAAVAERLLRQLATDAEPDAAPDPGGS